MGRVFVHSGNSVDGAVDSNDFYQCIFKLLQICFDVSLYNYIIFKNRNQYKSDGVYLL